MDKGKHRLPAPGIRRLGHARAVRHVEEVRGPTEKKSTTIAAFIGAGPMSQTVVGLDEVVGVDDGDAGDGLVLGRRRREWTGSGSGYGGSGGGSSSKQARNPTK